MDDLRVNIARRKRRDAFFAVLGALLIIASLAVLGVLVADLVRDGHARLVAGTDLRADGQPPSRRDVLGTLRLGQAPDGKPAWFVVREPIPADVSQAGDVAPFDGRRVLITATLPDSGEAMEVEKVVAYPLEGERPRIGRRDLVGVLNRLAPAAGAAPGAAGAAWSFTPQKVWLDNSEVPGLNLAALKDRRVAVTGAFRPAEGSVLLSSAMALKQESFFTTMPSRKAGQAGIHSAWVGTCLVMLVTVVTALPLGVGAGLYLEEYARKGWLTGLIEINIANLAGVPSIIWGLMGLGLFVYKFHFEHSILTAGLTLGLLVLPIIIMTTREAIRAIPAGIRDAAFALGATKWETVRYHVLPYSMGGILTGTIMSVSRAIGETAPLIVVGALTYVPFLPPSPVRSSFPFVSMGWLHAPFTVMPIQMFNWISRPDPAFHANAAAAGIVLLVMTLGMNAVAIYLRFRLRRKIKW
jgi:phosphate transport system permease protein